MEILVQLPTWLSVILWYLIGFIPGLWTVSAGRRYSNRDFPCIAREVHWNDLWLPFFVAFTGTFGAFIHVFVAIIFECGERPWFDFMDRPIFPKKDK